ncbi:MAG: hypothetical protein KF760_28625 [Candidatus Eremiobacteraeota bacterium]|nr:hypothetical protein [Candidatus Eremiobacteraeota bacterium]MCW5865861.1 hypothetical protein [Candidatus Eremiobacteraeota bacterium]
MSTPACQFCQQHPSVVTVTTQAPEQEAQTLRLCQRCGYLHQVVSQVAVLEQAMPAPPCFLCTRLSAVTAEMKDKQGQLVGRYRLCEACVKRQEFTAADILRVATPWTPGVLELPPPKTRVFPKPRHRMPGNN